MLHQVGVSFDLYYDARKNKIKIKPVLYSLYRVICLIEYLGNSTKDNLTSFGSLIKEVINIPSNQKKIVDTII